MFYILTTMVLDATFGIVEWTSKKLVSYVWNMYTPCKIRDKSHEEFLEIIEKHQTQLEYYNTLIEQQQTQIQSIIMKQNPYRDVSFN